MAKTIFLAGASGVIGRSLVPLLLEAGHDVIGSTRTEAGRARLDALGIQSVVVDVYDAEALERIMASLAPGIVLHQLTDLADPATDQAAMSRRNARLRREGTANLVRAARSGGVTRIVAQSIAWAYRPAERPLREDDPLDIDATGARAITVKDGVVPLEAAILGQPDFAGIVLRYGQLWGPGTWSETPTGASPLHVDAAAYAAFLAIDHGHPGPYNIAEPGGAVDVERALTELGWRPDFRLSPGGTPPNLP
jgi:nucleoside-diphosphate-sugar epimerase